MSILFICVCVCVRVCVWEREREREERDLCVCVCKCFCVCVPLSQTKSAQAEGFWRRIVTSHPGKKGKTSKMRDRNSIAGCTYQILHRTVTHHLSRFKNEFLSHVAHMNESCHSFMSYIAQSWKQLASPERGGEVQREREWERERGIARNTRECLSIYTCRYNHIHIWMWMYVSCA